MNTQRSDAELAQILEREDIFHLIGDTADQLGVECYVVGGFVRDIFLERPSKDIDVEVVGSGIAVAEALAKNLRKMHLWANLSVFRNFGTAQVKFRSKKGEETEVEFVGARRESYSRNSRKPIVEDGTLDDDLDRRDLTINALAICLNHDRFGQLIDPFDGLYDMEDGLIRTPLDPDITFSDDPLRMLRAVRFATQLGFHIDDETFEALERNRDRIRIISQERIIDELNKIMMAKHPSKGWVELSRCGLLPIIFPELAAMEGVETMNGRAHKDNFYHTMEVLENVVRAQDEAACTDEPCPQKDPLWLRWAALLHDIGKPRSKRWEPATGWTFHNHNYLGERMVPDIFRRFKLPMDERMKYVQKLVSLHMRPIAIADEEVTDSAVRRMLFEAGEDIDDLMTLCEADITSKNREKKARFLDNFRLVREKLVDLQARDNYRTWTNPITGEEIMQTFNLTPCRQVGELKQAIKDAIWESRIPNTHEAAFEFMLEEAKRRGMM
ncbi:MAG: HD domain-containing protein [Bacteroidales bacterium]|nr:HD domain-containing protein [Candidatus Physcousia equi]